MSTQGRSVLCIDFGTSSIRAAIRHGNRTARPIPIGAAFGSSIDSASIPSAIFLSDDFANVAFGQEALTLGMTGRKAAIFDISPKKWMTAGYPSDLMNGISDRTNLTKLHLLSGLIAQSLSAICKSEKLRPHDLAELEIRLSHPIWPGHRKSELLRHLIGISKLAISICGLTDRLCDTETFLAKTRGFEAAANPPEVDVEEPVAAALQLFDNDLNSREICAVIDVGAGTMDMGIFLSLTPDAASHRHRRKLIQAAPPRSIFKAGDFIDDALLNLITHKSKTTSDVVVSDLNRRRRSIKESLFESKKIYEAGVEVQLDELQALPQIHAMSEELASTFGTMLHEASSYLSTFVDASFHRTDKVNVIFAGGGASIDFLHRAVPSNYNFGSGRKTPVSITSYSGNYVSLPASIDRLAVAIGGTTDVIEWPQTVVSFKEELMTQWDRMGNWKPGIWTFYEKVYAKD